MVTRIIIAIAAGGILGFLGGPLFGMMFAPYPTKRVHVIRALQVAGTVGGIIGAVAGVLIGHFAGTDNPSYPASGFIVGAFLGVVIVRFGVK